MTSFYISPVEKSVLYRKYYKLGYSPEEAGEKISLFCNHLKTLKEALHRKKMPPADINVRFKKEFEELCQRLDSGNDYLLKLKKGAKRR